MRYAKYMYNVFFQAKELFVIAVGALGILLGDLITNLVFESPIFFSGYRDIISPAIYIFAAFLFISFEFGRKIPNSKFDEVLSVVPQGRKQIMSSQLLVLSSFTLVSALAGLVFVFVLTIKNRQSEPIDSKVIMQLVFSVLLYYFLIPLAAVFLGSMLSLFFSRFYGYLFIVIFVLFASPITYLVCATFWDAYDIKLHSFADLFGMFPIDIDWTPTKAFGYSVFLPYQWAKPLFWLFFSLCLISLKLSKKKKSRSLSLIPLALSVFFLFVTYLPQSKVIKTIDNPSDTVMYDRVYYADRDQPLEEEADFKIKSYKLDFKIGSKLYADAHITIEKPTGTEYKFTLYHRYKIKSVKSISGEKLSFEQNGDHFTITDPGATLTDFLISYSGFSTSDYYSNYQGTFLPGYFAYYPIPGIKAMYLWSPSSVNPLYLEYDADFEVTVKNVGKIYCSLPYEDGKYRGRTNGVTLLAGLYKEMTYDGIRVVYPYMEDVCTPDHIKKYVKKYKNTVVVPENIKTVFIQPWVYSVFPFTNYCRFSDCVVMNVGGVDKYQQEFRASYPYRLKLWAKYLCEQYDGLSTERPDLFEERVLSNAEPGGAINLFVEFISHYSKEEAVALIEEYVNDKNDKRTYEEFFSSYKENL